MKLEGLARTALATIAFTVLSTACTVGTDFGKHPSGDPVRANPPSGGGGSSGSGGAGDGGGASDTGTDAYNPFGNPDSGGAGADAPVTPFDSSVATDGGSSSGCGLTATQSACVECCATSNPAGTGVLNAAIQACACGTSGTCSSQCATEVCAGVPAVSGSACFTCLSATLASGGACYTPVQTTCTADPGCSALLACQSSECAGKP